MLTDWQFLQVNTVATTMTLAEQNHAEELKRVCLEFVSKNLSAVMVTEGYKHMLSSCPTLQVALHHFWDHILPQPKWHSWHE